MIRENASKVLSQIKSAANRSGRKESEITLVCASKYALASQIKEACLAGVTVFGENKVQDALEKSWQLKDLKLDWQMIGHLQTNKAKEAVKLFSLIHSVDSLRLAQEIDKQAGKVNKRQDVLIEVNTTSEPQKYGVSVQGAVQLAKSVLKLRNIRLKGLMTMGCEVVNPDENRKYFRLLGELRDEINKDLAAANYPVLTILSMGMTNDFEAAIEEGSTMVRIGRAIFENSKL